LTTFKGGKFAKFFPIGEEVVGKGDIFEETECAKLQ
jgi:hypothetical protein